MTKIRSTDAEAIATAIERGEEFQTHGSLKGYVRAASVIGRYHPGMGRLPRGYENSLRDSDYVIYSYATPIAWRTEGVWEMPDEKYSVTTSKQQGTVRRAMRYLHTYPRKTADGRTVWACCESSIGPACQHVSA